MSGIGKRIFQGIFRLFLMTYLSPIFILHHVITAVNVYKLNQLATTCFVL